MFQGKIYSYTNVDGKAKQVQKEFHSFKDYMDYIYSQSPQQSHSKKMSGCCGGNFYEKLNSFSQDLGIPLQDYKESLEAVEQENRETRKRAHMLKSLRTTLEAYKKEFEDHNKKELVQNVTKDISTIDAELKSLGFEGSSREATSSSRLSDTAEISEKTKTDSSSSPKTKGGAKASKKSNS